MRSLECLLKEKENNVQKSKQSKRISKVGPGNTPNGKLYKSVSLTAKKKKKVR